MSLIDQAEREHAKTVEARERLLKRANETGASATFHKRTLDAGANLVRLADVARGEIEWLWPNRIAVGKLSLLSGDPGLGKSLLSLAIAAQVSLGSRWPVDGGNAPIGDVILLSAEDDLADTIRPRLEAAGANLHRIHALPMVRTVNDDGSMGERMFSLERDIALLDTEIGTLKGACRLIVIDPISAYMGAVDSHKNADVRGLLAPLAELAQRHHVAILGVTHLNKSVGKAIYRTMGSLAYTAAARAVWGVARDESNPSRRLVLPIKNNLAPEVQGLAYEIQTANGAPVLLWETEPVDVSMDDALYQDDEQTEVEEAADWLRDVLSAGRVPVTELQKLVKQAGYSWATVRRAKDKIRAKSERDGFGREGKFYWSLPIDAHAIDAQRYSQTLSTYDETRTTPSLAGNGKDSNPHRCSTVNKYGDEHLCDDAKGKPPAYTEVF